MSPNDHIASTRRWTTLELESLADELLSYAGQTQLRGHAYAEQGRVGEIEGTRSGFGARVRGTDLYTAWWTLDDDVWTGECSCPVEFDCKHLFAVAAVFLAPRRDETFIPRELRRRLPELPVRVAHIGRPLHPDAPARPPAPRREVRPDPTEHDLEAMRKRGLQALLTGTDAHQRHEGFRELRAGLSSYLRPSTPTLSSFSSEFSDPDPQVRVHRVLKHMEPGLKQPYPPELAAHIDTPAVLQVLAAREEARVRDSLRRWTQQSAAFQRSLRFTLEVRRESGIAHARLIPRLTARKLVDSPRTEAQLIQLATDADRDASLLAPEQRQMIRAFLGPRSAWSSYPPPSASSTNTLRAVLEVGGKGGVAWDASNTDEDLAAIGVARGDAVKLSTEPVALVLVAAATGGAVALSVQWLDGELTPAREAVLITAASMLEDARDPWLIACRGMIHVVRESMPRELMRGLLGVGSVTVDPRRDQEWVRPLAQRTPSLKQSLGTAIRTHHVHPVFVLDDDGEHLWIRLFATTNANGWVPFEPPAADDRLFEFTGPDGWIASDGAADDDDRIQRNLPAPASGDWLEEVSVDDVAAAEAWLRAAEAIPQRDPDYSSFAGFRIRMSGASLDRFAESLASRPRDARWFAPPSVRRLFEDGATVRARVSAKKSGVDLFAVHAEYELNGAVLSDDDLARLRRPGGALVRLSSGWCARTQDEQLRSLEAALADLGVVVGEPERELTIWSLARASEATWAALESAGELDETRAALDAMRKAITKFKGIPRLPVPAGLQATLRPYQREGLDFLAWASGLGLGALLADDMGLGKTLQTLAWWLATKRREPTLGPMLVVAPASVMHNWQREAERFAPTLRVAMFESGAERKARFTATSAYDVLITNYALLRADIEQWEAQTLGAVVLDEAQNIKNPRAVVSESVRRLQARHRLALTGTPIENRALDLWSIMAFLNPGMLGSERDFRARYDRQDPNAPVQRLLAARLRPVLLRRRKQEVARELPDRIEERLDCDMTPAQRRLYQHELEEARAMIAAMSANPFGVEKSQIRILAALTRLRQLCCHPALVGEKPSVGSGKFEAFGELIDTLYSEGEKVLVFSSFVECLELLRQELRARGIEPHLLTGASRKRGAIVDAFQSAEGPGVFLISIKAGGAGLNLTAARSVVLFDPWWNPAVEAQAIDRAHRIGQARTVFAYRLITRGTIEDKIAELQQRKAAVAEAILGGEGTGQALTREDLDFLLSPA